MGLFEVLRSRLVVKFGAATLTVIAIGFSVATILSVDRQAKAFARGNREDALLLTESTIAGVRTAMLTGDPIAVRGYIDDVRRRLRGREVHVYDRRGLEVFAPPGAPPAPSSLPAPLRTALSGPDANVRDGDVHFLPLEHEDRCRRCHEAAPVRGVLALGPRPAGETTPSGADVDAEARIIRLAFEQIMAAKRSEELGPFFEELTRVTDRRVHVAVIDVAGEEKFGALPLVGDQNAGDLLSPAKVPDALLDSLMVRPGQEPDLAMKSFVETGTDLRFVPLANEARCHECHEPETGPMRGALVVGVRQLPGDDLVEATIDRSLRYIMLSGLGRLVIDYLEQAREGAGLTTLALYDPAGRVYHDAARRIRTPGKVRSVLRGGADFMGYVGSGEAERYLAVRRLDNDRPCVRCHGTEHEIRGAVVVSSPTDRERREIAGLRRSGVGFGAGTILVVFGLLWVTTKRLVVDPVRHIGDVAEAIGQGKLDRQATIGSSDEIGRLGQRINEMVKGLRERLQLAKFVSGGTLEAVRGGEDVRLGGERRRLTVFFSDIRGFTAFTERTEPERVVAMLNAYLRVQTDLVHEHGGDVDKYVGDELVAVFAEPAAAIRCGLAAVEAVEAIAAQGGDGLGIGVGIHTGDVVRGTVGHEDRMDFTVIGDAVNTGARICAAAPRGSVLVSLQSKEETPSGTDVDFAECPPLEVKGKAKALVVFEARRRSA